MNKWLDEFKRLYSKDKVTFILHCLKSGFILLFLIGLIMPFIVGSTLDNGRVSMSALPLAILYVLPQVIFLFSYIFTVLNKNVKLSISLFKAATIVGTITILWGFIVFFVGFNSTDIDLGTGMMFMIIFNFCMWYLFVAEKKAIGFISKYTKDSVTSQVEASESRQEK